MHWTHCQQNDQGKKIHWEITGHLNDTANMVVLKDIRHFTTQKEMAMSTGYYIALA